jgi:hypothetical protein
MAVISNSMTAALSFRANHNLPDGVPATMAFRDRVETTPCFRRISEKRCCGMPARSRSCGGLVLLLFLGFVGVVGGCGQSRLDFAEVKGTDEKVTESEMISFLRIIEALPEKKLPELPTVFAPPPNWKPTRRLPVSDLVKEEQHNLSEHWSVERLVEQLPRQRSLQRALSWQQMNPDRFIGLTLAIGIALSRATLHDRQDLDELVETGRMRIRKLKSNDAVFAQLSEENQHAVLREAAWITRVDRANRLAEVPPENLALVQSRRERLEQIFPPEFTVNPLDTIADLLEEQGIPFEELPLSGRDDQIEWDRDEAHIGTDRTASRSGTATDL